MYQPYGYMARAPGWLWPWATPAGVPQRVIEPEHQGDTAKNLIAVGHPVEGADAVGLILARFWVAVTAGATGGGDELERSRRSAWQPARSTQGRSTRSIQHPNQRPMADLL